MEIVLENYENMIRQKSWQLVSRFNLDEIYDYEDLFDYGIEIFYDCLQKFDSLKSSFSTYLYTQLKRLNYTARKKAVYYKEIENYYNYYEGRVMQDFNIVDFYDVEDDSKLIFKFLIDKWILKLQNKK